MEQHLIVGGPLDGQILRARYGNAPIYHKLDGGIYVQKRLSAGVVIYNWLAHHPKVNPFAKKRVSFRKRRVSFAPKPLTPDPF